MKRLILLVLGLLILPAFPGSGAAQTPADETNNDNSKGAITGRVVDQNGQPLANAVVAVRSYGNSSRGGTATTDREGNFQVSGLDPYAYIVTANLPAYIAVPRDPDATPVGFYRVGETAKIELM